ncbi:hypothetical protein GW756_00005 [bacterium]|nr:hypothetical protein [bacterium]NCQ54740.1 hypothetical protein [Candidatus Parcubacteria bacterium]NCS67993.1 hypothetical protein [Candidatus Peregrinibacteria bacterium]NCS95730.1 hypothetical protein [bacterium]
MIESKYILFVSFGLILALAVWWAFDWYNFYQHMQIGKNLASKAQRFERLLPQADFKILVLGDSTAVGTGTTNNTYSVAGRLAEDLPNSSIKNLGVNGALVSDLNSQLDQVGQQNFDLIIIQAGGNDVVYFTDLKKFETDLATVLQKVTEKSDRVIMLSSGDIGASPIWPAGVGWIFTKRTLEARQILLEKTAAYGVAFVDLYSNGVNVEFGKEPVRYHSPDSFHPSDEGYELWYESLKMNFKNRGWLSR